MSTMNCVEFSVVFYLDQSKLCIFGEILFLTRPWVRSLHKICIKTPNLSQAKAKAKMCYFILTICAKKLLIIVGLRSSAQLKNLTLKEQWCLSVPRWSWLPRYTLPLRKKEILWKNNRMEILKWWLQLENQIFEISVKTFNFSKDRSHYFVHMFICSISIFKSNKVFDSD